MREVVKIKFTLVKDIIDEALNAAKRHTYVTARVETLAMCACALAYMGKVDEAKKLVSEAIKIAKKAKRRIASEKAAYAAMLFLGEGRSMYSFSFSLYGPSWA